MNEIQLVDWSDNVLSSDLASKIEKIIFANMEKFPKFQKRHLKEFFGSFKEKVIEVHLDDNIELTRQLPYFLKEFNEVRKLTIRNALIDENSLNIFDEVEQIEELNLLGSKFPNDHFPTKLISKLTSLTVLKIQGSDCGTKRIKTFDENVFFPLTKLVSLDLVYNRIEILPENLFQSLSKLEILELARNEIEILPQKLFKNNLNLQELDISKNRLKEIHVDFRTLPKISELSLWRNDCTEKWFHRTSEIHEKAEFIMNECKPK